ncbi:MAG: DNA cytosine methyltransferase [Alteromonas sp.]|nr:DNA cytosine methyltransferase [Alteromonas sp.]
MNELALFAGAGGGILGGHLLGWRTVCAVEWDAYAASVLVQRQNDGCLPPFPIWDDVQTFDGRPWTGRVDVISGGFPCQDISAAGKGAGIDGERSGMWGHMARIVGEVQPRFVFVENSPMLVGRGLARVLADLTSLGYDSRWAVLGAHHVAAPHKRDRIWIVGNSDSNGKPVKPFDEEAPELQEDVSDSDLCRFLEPIDDKKRKEGVESRESPGNCCGTSKDVADSQRTGLEGQSRNEQGGSESGRECEEAGRSVSSQSVYGRKRSACWPTESDLGRGLPDELADRVDINGTAAQGGLSRVGKGIPHRVDRLKCIGNGQVPQCAALAWKILRPNE